MRDTVKISASPDGRGTHTFVCVFVWIPVILLQWSPSLVSLRSQMNCRVKLWEKHLRQLSLLILPTAGPQEKGKKSDVSRAVKTKSSVFTSKVKGVANRVLVWFLTLLHPRSLCHQKPSKLVYSSMSFFSCGTQKEIFSTMIMLLFSIQWIKSTKSTIKKLHASVLKLYKRNRLKFKYFSHWKASLLS